MSDISFLKDFKLNEVLVYSKSLDPSPTQQESDFSKIVVKVIRIITSFPHKKNLKRISINR